MKCGCFVQHPHYLVTRYYGMSTSNFFARVPCAHALANQGVRAMNLPTTMTLDPVLSWPPYFCVTCLLGVQGRLIGSVQGRLIWRVVYLEGSLPPANSLPFKKKSSLDT